MSFPFEVPEDLGALSSEQFTAFREQVTQHASEVAGDESAPAGALIETHKPFSAVTTEHKRREDEKAAALAALRA